ncbi:FkbM family methyltransferase [Methylobacterium nodulans]|uniref:Methyltransferase FkbM family n=1 Tax=Methylobacterium nodulans (strain LMG 21967 / CNCM I-2342 / ORS 2060) TaxID=460265 RepID=B8IH43_METNO|nr:FkbM family methyltransferase [Methylobacterium nodulans]ACL59735.1 methyltransferase FkbM family [Methylobacterium nodulans ORS 2060]
MTPAGQTICLSMIVRNEAPVIRRSLASVRPLIDHWIVVDTGSTDGTQDLVREAMAGLPGRLIERPWRDFGHNRSEALAFARPHGDYTLIIDADDEILPAPGFAMPALDADSYALDIQDGPIAYQRTQVVRAALPWRYAGVLHEFLTCPEASSSGHLPLVMRRNHDGARRRDPGTYRRDAEILERALATEADPFLIARYTFYLAQSYRDCGAREEAVVAYLRRAELGFWDQEVFFSLYQAGQLMEALGRDPETILETYRRASAACPSRAEAAHAASRFCRLRERFAQGCALAEPALGIEPPPGGLFVEGWIYAYGLLDEYAVNAYWAGRYRDCLDACLKLLAEERLPEGYRARITANARFAFDKLAGASPRPAEPAPLAPLTIGRASVRSDWTPARPQAGTELMVEGLRSRMGDALDAVQLCINLFDEARLDGRPLVLWIHHDIDQQAVQWLRDRAKMGRVDRFVFVSEWQQARFVAAFALPPERCIVLRNATEMPAADRVWTMRRPLRLAYTSTPFRGLSVLLDAWDRLRPADAELHIWSSHRLYGPAFDDAPYQALFARATALPNVHYHGIVPNPDLRAALRGIDMLAYPSTFAETSCLSAIEALAAGCRVVCPDLGALPETVGRFGRIYPFEPDPDAHADRFAAVLRDEIANPWGGQPSLAAAQQQEARMAYDWPVRTAEWRRLLDDIARERALVPGSLAPTPRAGVFEALARLRDRGFSPSGIIDAGAYDGHFARGLRRIFSEAHILMVDALAEKGPVLEAVCREIGNASHAIALLGDRETEAASFFVVDTEARPDLVKTGSSKFRENADFPMEERRVPQRRLADVLADHGRPFGLIKLDVQGAEVEVLRGLGDRLAEVEVILMELSLLDYNRGAPLVAAVLSDLTAMGFVLFDIVEEHRYRDGSLLQIDGLLVRAESRFRPGPPFWT